MQCRVGEAAVGPAGENLRTRIFFRAVSLRNQAITLRTPVNERNWILRQLRDADLSFPLQISVKSRRYETTGRNLPSRSLYLHFAVISS